MRKIYLFILIIFCSCSNNEIEGTWVGSYKLFNFEGKQKYEPLNTIIKIKGNTFYNQTFGLEKDNGNFTFDFKKIKNSIVPEDNSNVGFNIESFSEDSLVLSIPEMEEFKLVYRKLDEQNDNVNWNPAGKSYRFNGNKSVAFAEYINDSIMIEYGLNSESVSINKWGLEKFENYTFLVIQYPISTVPLLIDSTTSKVVYLKSLEDKIRKYSYQLQPKETSSGLIGEWILADKEYDTLTKQRIDYFSSNNIKHLTISKDSVELEGYQTKQRYGWVTSVSEKMIFLIGDEYRVLKILDLNKNEMALEIGLERYENIKRFTYRRKY